MTEQTLTSGILSPSLPCLSQDFILKMSFKRSYDKSCSRHSYPEAVQLLENYWAVTDVTNTCSTQGVFHIKLFDWHTIIENIEGAFTLKKNLITLCLWGNKIQMKLVFFMLPTARWDFETFVKMSTTPVRSLIKESQPSEHKFSKVGIISQTNKRALFLKVSLCNICAF